MAVEEGVSHADNGGYLFKLLDKTVEDAVAGNKVNNRLSDGKVIDDVSSISIPQFKNDDLLKEHYQKHVIDRQEFGDITINEYLKSAQKLVTSDVGRDILTKTRKSGDTVYYNKATNEFAVITKDGTIKTYFKPEEGEKYFRDQ